MQRSPRNSIVLASFFVASTATAQTGFGELPVDAAGLAGNWEMTSESPQGEIVSRLEITEEEGVLAGTIENQYVGRQEFSEVREIAGMVELRLAMPGTGDPIYVLYEGLIDGDQMTGTVKGLGINPPPEEELLEEEGEEVEPAGVLPPQELASEPLVDPAVDFEEAMPVDPLAVDEVEPAPVVIEGPVAEFTARRLIPVEPETETELLP